MDKKALQLCAHFALQPNQLGFCGRNSAPAKLKECIVDGNCKQIEKELKKFIVLNPYLQTIAEVTNLDPFSYKVIEAYWLGNDLLEQFKLGHYQILLKYFVKQGVPGWLVKELENKQPKVFIPIHLFNILHVGVGKASGSVPFNLESINNCMVRWGKVKSIINSQKLKIEAVKLKKQNDQYILGNKISDYKYYSQLVGKLKIGDQVAVHWGWIAKKITQKEKEEIRKWTDRLIENL
jgi:hydrogenase maturation factor